MTVGDLLPRLSGLASAPAPLLSQLAHEQVVTAIAYDSRQVEHGAIFVAVRGQDFDGTRFAPAARMC